jgi:hypothetical protein
MGIDTYAGAYGDQLTRQWLGRRFSQGQEGRSEVIGDMLLNQRIRDVDVEAECDAQPSGLE